MILRLFKGVLPSKLFLVLLLAILGWAPLFIWDVAVMQNFTLPYFADYFVWVNNLWPWSVATTMLVLTSLQAIYIIQINFKYILIDQRTYMPALIFGLMSVFLVNSPNAIAVLVANLVLLACFDILFANSGLRISVKAMFNIGLLLAFSSMFLWQSVFLIPLLWVLSFVVNQFNIRGLLASAIGFFSIWLLYFYGLYLFSDVAPFVLRLTDLYNEVKVLAELQFTTYIPVLTSSLLLLFGFLVSIFSLGNKKIITRKYYFTLSLSVTFIIVAVILLNRIPIEYLYLMVAPLSFMASGYLLQSKIKWIPDIVLLVFFAGVALFWVNKITGFFL
jgi:hypothetical protein